MLGQSKPEPLKIAIVGGGLAGCLTAHALASLDSKTLQITLFEKQPKLCGAHTWSLHQHDIPENQLTWFKHLVSRSWPAYDVYFPQHQQTLNSAYLSIRSQDLALKTDALSQQGRIEIKLNADCSILSNQTLRYDTELLKYDYIIDARGWKPASRKAQLDGYQKFVGLEVELSEPHHLTRPIVMDARVSQIDGYRFMYVLPLAEQSLLIEDTYYSNGSELDEALLTKRTLEYAEQHKWKVAQIRYREKGCLLIPSVKPDHTATIPGLITVGVQGQQYQPVTGYSTPYILSDLEILIEGIRRELSCAEVADRLSKKREAHSLQTKFYIVLNRMLFGAAEPHERYKILQRFYTFDNKLIQRFYSGKTNIMDMIRILSGKPPVSVRRALKVLFFSAND